MTKGYLVFIGGGKDSTFINQRIFELAGGKDNVKLAIIPSASSDLSKTIESYKQYFENELGIKSENIWAVPLSASDSESELSSEEKLWQNNAYNDDVVKKIKEYNVIFLVGGDQRKYIQALKRNNINSPLLNAVDEIYKNGGIIAGTSAGSNVMSKNSIGGGRSEEALINKIAHTSSEDDGEKLFLFNGLNLIDDVIVDTHFAKRGRLGRLIQSAVITKSRFGLGISEETAIIFHPDSLIEVTGYGSVTMIDLAESNQISKDSEQLHVLSVKTHLFSTGDSFNIKTGAFFPYKSKRKIKFTPYNGVKDYRISLNAFKEHEVPIILTKYMLDNEAKEAIAIVDYEKQYIEGNKSSFLRFIEAEETDAYYCKEKLGNRNEEYECYSGINIYTDIIPLNSFDTQGWSKRLNAVVFGIMNDLHVVVFDNDRTSPICDAKIELYQDRELIYRTGTNKFGKATLSDFLTPELKYTIIIEYDRDNILKDFEFKNNMQGFYLNN